ncbi:MAG: ABC transporter permease, partial [Lachnospiraceae bacterium]|nr:ABC transporter permease [Lachnospiraceae bacterium]
IFSNSFLSAHVPEAASPFIVTIILFVIVLVCKVLLDAYLQTRSGYLLRAVGDNDVLVTSLAKDKGLVKIVGLAIANGLVSLSGCIFAQEQRFFDVSMGTGTMVIGLASVIIGTSLFRKVTFLRVTTSVVVGSVIYKACVALAINLGFASTDLKFITAALFLIILVLGMERKRKVNIHA